MGNPFPKLFSSGQMILGVHWQLRAKTMKFHVKKMIAVKIFRQQLGLSSTGIIEIELVWGGQDAVVIKR